MLQWVNGYTVLYPLHEMLYFNTNTELAVSNNWMKLTDISMFKIMLIPKCSISNSSTYVMFSKGQKTVIEDRLLLAGLCVGKGYYI